MSRPPARTIAGGILALLAFVGLVSLGTWQIHRRTWKLALIAQVEERLRAAPVAAPGPAEWPGNYGARDGYRRIGTTGVYLDDRDTFVQAVTDLGSGYWVLTPFRDARGFIILVNRGFVSRRATGKPPRGPMRVTGLLRLTEPHGGFLQANDPAADRWHSRDVAAIAAARRLGMVAPYFIDADALSSPRGGPIGGLTVIRFDNNHLVYALTWYMLALMVAGLAVAAIWRHRRSDAPPAE